MILMDYKERWAIAKKHIKEKHGTVKKFVEKYDLTVPQMNGFQSGKSNSKNIIDTLKRDGLDVPTVQLIHKDYQDHLDTDLGLKGKTKDRIDREIKRAENFRKSLEAFKRF